MSPSTSHSKSIESVSSSSSSSLTTRQPPLSFSRRFRGPILTSVVVMTATVSAIVYSHYAQTRDKAIMRAGVERDRERLKQLRNRAKQEQEQ